MRVDASATNELRFRPNIVLAATEDRTFVEDDWVGRVLEVAGAAVRVDARDTRCIIVNVDPASGQPDARLLKAFDRQ